MAISIKYLSVLLCLTVEPVEEILIVWQTVIRDELHDLLVRLHPGQLAQPGGGVLLQHLPHHLVPHTPHVEDDSLVAAPGRQDHLLAGDGLRGLVQGVECYIRQGGRAGPAPKSCKNISKEFSKTISIVFIRCVQAS